MPKERDGLCEIWIFFSSPHYNPAGQQLAPLCASRCVENLLVRYNVYLRQFKRLSDPRQVTLNPPKVVLLYSSGFE